jgi:hypothetical protein
MSVQSAPYFWVVCDCCGARADYGEFAAWSDAGQARDYSESGFESVDGLDLCAACWIWPEDMPDYDEAKWQGSDDPVRRHAAHPQSGVPCQVCGWTGPQTQYLGDTRRPIQHPWGPHEPDWLPKMLAHQPIEPDPSKPVPCSEECDWCGENMPTTQPSEPEFRGWCAYGPCSLEDGHAGDHEPSDPS